MSNPDRDEIAKVLYEAVCETAHGVVVRKWSDLEEDEKVRWLDVAKTLLGVMGK